MSRLLVVRPATREDIQAAFRWYEGQSAGLGAEFLRVIDAVLSSVERNPELYPVSFRRMRRALLRRFPYALYFVPHPERIDVVGCFHVRRNPRRWRSRS
jgi:plasmid stabilization system protein ParE